MWKRLPKSIETSELGRLSLQTSGSLVLTSYYYEPASEIVLLGFGPIEIAVWPPERVQMSATDLGLHIDQDWSQITSRMLHILKEAETVVHAAIARFWQIDDESPPSSLQLLNTARLTNINIDLGDQQHEVILHDEANLIGSHDLILELNAQYTPCSARFDG